ncbi:5-methyltetrahydropteroyltriglutamate--homocysteine methyltransferase 2 [Forsythia ovata]|uniref:5-methyltetrahydropteroyltriglutamate--homocysteine methyltransferase 2 n=1 Tax=Forsythia ovata TaxID=205694 RepID=A0ABD1VK61_9LAMI
MPNSCIPYLKKNFDKFLVQATKLFNEIKHILSTSISSVGSGMVIEMKFLVNSIMLLSKPAKGVEKTFPLLSLLGKILPVYKEVIAELKAAGVSWIQFDEPTLVKDLESHQLEAFTKAYAEFPSRRILSLTNYSRTSHACVV